LNQINFVTVYQRCPIGFLRLGLEQECQTGSLAPLLLLCGPNRNFHNVTIQLFSLFPILFTSFCFKNKTILSTENVILPHKVIFNPKSLLYVACLGIFEHLAAPSAVFVAFTARMAV